MQLPKEELLLKIRNGYALPALSPVVVRLMELATSEACSVGELSVLIEEDPSLAVRVVQLANSAFMRNGVQVSTIAQAIQRIGVNQLRIMALSLSLRETFPLAKAGPVDYEEFWRGALYRAVIAKSLAARLHTCNPDEAFISALTLEIGFLVFIDLFIKGRSGIRGIKPCPLEDLIAWERKEFGIDHREIGEAALRYWRFPEHIVACQRSYHVNIRESEVPPLALVCDVARSFSSIINDKAVSWHVPFYAAKSLYGIESDVLAKILSVAFDEVEDVSMTLKVVASREKDLAAVLDKARHALAALHKAAECWQHYAAGKAVRGRERASPGEGSYTTKQKLEMVAEELAAGMATILEFAEGLRERLDRLAGPWKQTERIRAECMRLECTLAALRQ
ncbi:MAG: HDOD domain-containing protein [Nitrospirota bacterium]